MTSAEKIITVDSDTRRALYLAYQGTVEDAAAAAFKAYKAIGCDSQELRRSVSRFMQPFGTRLGMPHHAGSPFKTDVAIGESAEMARIAGQLRAVPEIADIQSRLDAVIGDAFARFEAALAAM